MKNEWNSVAGYSRSVGVSPARQTTRLWGKNLSGSLQGVGGVGGMLAERHRSDSAATYHPTHDGNGNVSKYLATNGTTAAHFEYDPFGNTVVNTDTSNQFTYRFITKPRDSETGLYYYGYRYYDPVTGRRPFRDPIAERGGVNLNSFGYNSPTNGYDYLGNSWVEQEILRLLASPFDVLGKEIERGLQGASNTMTQVPENEFSK